MRCHVDQLHKCLDEFDADTVMLPEREGSETVVKWLTLLQDNLLHPQDTAMHTGK